MTHSPPDLGTALQAQLDRVPDSATKDFPSLFDATIRRLTGPTTPTIAGITVNTPVMDAIRNACAPRTRTKDASDTTILRYIGTDVFHLPDQKAQTLVFHSPTTLRSYLAGIVTEDQLQTRIRKS